MTVGGCHQQSDPAPANVHPTIVSLNPCSDAVLAEVAAPGQVVAISHYSQDPASSSMDLEKAAQFRTVSGSAEEVLALRPDLIVADQFLAPATRSALERTGMEVVTVPIARNVEESRAQVLDLARLTGDENPGILLNARIDAALARIEDGSYGYCEETGEPIGLKRLDARPIATLSLEAQERHERQEKISRDD